MEGTRSQPPRLHLIGGATRSVRTYARGRECAAEGCATKLSIYNPSRFCALHSRPEHARALPRRQRVAPEVRTCAHEACGKTFVTENPARLYCSSACRMKAFQQRKRLGQPQEERAA